MVVTKTTEIDIRKVRQAKKVMAALELLGITEEDLLAIKAIPQMRAELDELREFRDRAQRTEANEAKARQDGAKSINDAIREAFKQGTEEFRPDAG